VTAKPVTAASPVPLATGQGAADSRTGPELYLAETRQLFKSMDPAPYRERDLDPKAAAYIIDRAWEAPSGRPPSLIVHLERESAAAEDSSMLSEAVHEYFRRRAIATRRQLRQLFRVGRISLLIGVAFLGVAVAAGEFLAGLVREKGYAWLLKESLVIGGWVALWRRMEIFLYDWWPILAARLHDRLSAMGVRVPGTGATVSA
jgi:hypothetical protein